MVVYSLILLYVSIVGLLVLLTKRPAVCPSCLSIDPYEGPNYYHCNHCGKSWAKD